MGAEGAGLATLLSRIMQLVAIALYFLYAKRLRPYKEHLSIAAISSESLRSLISVGYPISFQMVLESAAFILSSILALSFGEVAAGSMQVAFSIANIAWMITVAIGSASTIVMSHIYGNGHHAELRPTVTATYHLGLAWATIMALIFVLFRQPMAALFTDNAGIVALPSQLMLLLAIYQFNFHIKYVTVCTQLCIIIYKNRISVKLCHYINVISHFFCFF